MSLQEIKEYHFSRNQSDQVIFSLSEISFEKACTANRDDRIDTFDIIWIREGEANYTVDFKQYQVKGETLFFLSPGQLFSVTSEKIKKAYRIRFYKDFYCIESRNKDIACNGLLFNNIYEFPYIKPDERTTQKLEHLMLQLKEELEQPGEAHYDFLHSCLTLFLIHSTRTKKQQQMIEKEQGEDAITDLFSMYVDKHFREQHSVAFYADLLHLSPKSLSKKLHRMQHSTPSEVIKERIITEAKRELFYTGKSVKEIAYELGFEDPAYFTRFFKKATGHAPLLFKEMHLQTQRL
jgi:AraC-like DNA-binding protein